MSAINRARILQYREGESAATGINSNEETANAKAILAHRDNKRGRWREYTRSQENDTSFSAHARRLPFDDPARHALQSWTVLFRLWAIHVLLAKYELDVLHSPRSIYAYQTDSRCRMRTGTRR